MELRGSTPGWQEGGRTPAGGGLAKWGVAGVGAASTQAPAGCPSWYQSASTPPFEGPPEGGALLSEGTGLPCPLLSFIP